MLKKLRKMLKQQEGFTLVELAIVVVILGILAGVGIQQYGKVQERAKRAADDANIKVIASAVQMYMMLEEVGPSEIFDLVEEGYLDAIPQSPFGGGDTYEFEIEEQNSQDEFKPRQVTVYNNDEGSEHQRNIE